MLVSMLIGLVHLQAQTFINEYGAGVDEWGYRSIELPSGDFITCGLLIESETRKPSIVYSTSTSGELNWQETYGQEGYGWVHGKSILTSDGNIVLAGSSYELGADSNAFSLFKISPSGQELWFKAYPLNWRSVITEIIELDDGGMMAVGSTNPIPSTYYEDVLLIRFDADGDTLWTRTYLTPGQDTANDIILSTDGGLIVAGEQSDAFNDNEVAWLRKYDLEGNIIWTQTYEAELQTSGTRVKATSDGGYIIAGIEHDLFITYRDLLVIKTNAEGEEQWLQTYGGELDEWTGDLILDDDDSIFIIGYAEDQILEEREALLMSLSASGDSLWSQTYGYDGDDRFRSGIKTSDGRFLMTGRTEGVNAEDDDVLLVMSDMAGNVNTLGEYGSAAEFAVHPNPCQGSFRIIAELETSDTYLDIMSLSGELLDSKRMAPSSIGSESVDISHLSAGVYLLLLRSSDSASPLRHTRLVVY